MLYNFKGFSLDCCLVASEILFLGLDVTAILGYSNSSRAIAQNTQPHHRRKYSRSGKQGGRPAIFLTLSGVISMALRSELDVSSEFQEWVVDDVVPSAIRHGAYISPDITPVQAVAAKETLDRILDAAAPWEKLYDENRNKGFRWFGYRFYTTYVYCFLTKAEWAKINRLNPIRKEPNGRCDRLDRIHQFIEPETKTRLRDTVAVILGLLDVANTPEEFQELYRRKYSRVEQKQLNLS